MLNVEQRGRVGVSGTLLAFRISSHPSAIIVSQVALPS
jgi:hypothetical protein